MLDQESDGSGRFGSLLSGLQRQQHQSDRKIPRQVGCDFFKPKYDVGTELNRKKRTTNDAVSQKERVQGMEKRGTAKLKTSMALREARSIWEKTIAIIWTTGPF
jgi:hypothetical protein